MGRMGKTRLSRVLTGIKEFLFKLSYVRKLITEVKLSSRVPVSTKADCVPRLLSRAYNLSQDTRKPVFGFPTRSDTIRAVWPKEMAKRLGFRK